MRSIGVLSYPGELLCAPSSAIQGDDAHPFRELIEFRGGPALSAGWTTRIAPGKQFALAFRVFDFDAKWVSSSRMQLDLSVGSVITKLCGWPDPERNPPLYAVAHNSVVTLWSAERLMDLLRQQPLTT